MRSLAILLVAAALAACGPRASEEGADRGPDIIPRAELFGDPARSAAAISPRGDRVAFLAPHQDVLNVWVAPTDAMDQARPVTSLRDRGATKFHWSGDGAFMLYLVDASGEENAQLFAVDLSSGVSRALTPSGAVRAEIVSITPGAPNDVVVALNDRDPAWRDLYRIDIRTGDRTLLERNTQNIAAYVVDRQNAVRLGMRMRADGGVDILKRDARGWRSFLQIDFAHAVAARVLGFEADSVHFLMLDASERDRAALMRVNIDTGEKTLLGESPRADVIDAWIDPATQTAEAYGAEYLRREWRAITDEAQGDIAYFASELRGDSAVTSRSLDDTRWIIEEEGPQSPGSTWLYDRADPAARKLTLLFRRRPQLEARALQPMIPIEIPTRDGATLVAYYTLPPGADTDGDGKPQAPVATALVVHGGPWRRDSYGFNPAHQWLANRGYLVLSVNFRGSSGFGAEFLNAGNREWGGLMQDDLYDAVQWAIDQSLTAPDRVAILGGSYGGYAAIAALTFSPGRFACGASASGPTNLLTLLDSAPAYWTPYKAELQLRLGDASTPEGRRRLRRYSPAFTPSAIRDPLLLSHGARDVRVPYAETDRFAQALQSRNRSLVYVVFPDEGHGMARPANRLALAALTETFLQSCLRGRAQPLGDELNASSLQAAAGFDLIPELSRHRRAVSAAAPAARARPRPEAAPEEDPEARFVPPPADLPIPTSPSRFQREAAPQNSDAAPAPVNP
ncbi:MAG: prolyl oligopeptidase family serine peptidase [Alphaproteobacteria bacterium]|nr:prolyl oligopeptidase family serine peptidase [Alphaproteobacteria bacterium]